MLEHANDRAMNSEGSKEPYGTAKNTNLARITGNVVVSAENGTTRPGPKKEKVQIMQRLVAKSF